MAPPSPKGRTKTPKPVGLLHDDSRYLDELVRQEIARSDRLELENHQLRSKIRQGELLLEAFRWLNGGVYALILLITLAELHGDHAEHRVITERVIYALIGGSAVQLGAIALGLGKRIWT